MLGMLLICRFPYYLHQSIDKVYSASQVLIGIAPSYFRYLDTTAYKASALAKLMGFYTVEIKNIESGVIQAKHDLLVMENLFYEHKIANMYDLKGIRSRKIKPNQEGADRISFDGEWIEGMFGFVECITTDKCIFQPNAVLLSLFMHTLDTCCKKP